MQNYHALVYREEEREMLPLCKVYQQYLLFAFSHIVNSTLALVPFHGLH